MLAFTSTDGEAMQPDGKSIIVGTVGTSPTEQFGVTRFNADGSLDTTFNGTGEVQVRLPAEARRTPPQ